MVKKRVKGSGGGADQVTVKNMLKLPFFVGRGIKYHAAGRLYTPKPRRLGFMVTRNCNSKCIMCSIWKTGHSAKELMLGEIRQILSNPLFDSLKLVVLSGGEPTLREDLAQVAETILDCQPGIKQLAMDTNGLESSLVRQRVKEILSLPAYRRLHEFSVGISLHGYGATQEKIMGIPHAFDRVNETIRLLKELRMQRPLTISLTCVVQPLNFSELPRLYKFAQELELPIRFSPVCLSDFFIDSDHSKQQLMLGAEQVEELKAFWGNPRYNLPLSGRASWQEYFRMIEGERRRIPCALLHHGVFLDTDGSLYICGVDKSLIYGNACDAPANEIWYSDEAEKTRKRAKKYLCPTCTGTCGLPFSLDREFFYFARFLLKEKGKELLRKYL